MARFSSEVIKLIVNGDSEKSWSSFLLAIVSHRRRINSSGSDPISVSLEAGLLKAFQARIESCIRTVHYAIDGLGEWINFIGFNESFERLKDFVGHGNRGLQVQSTPAVIPDFKLGWVIR
jgi:hypothetical protein